MSWIDIEQSPHTAGAWPLSKKAQQRNRKRQHDLLVKSMSKEQRRALKKQRRLERKLARASKVKFHRPKYETYILSTAWRDRCQRYWRENGRRCQACGDSNQLTVHHTHYGFLGREQDKHLAGLCWPCHKALHDKYGTHTVMQEQTAEFIADVKGHVVHTLSTILQPAGATMNLYEKDTS